LELPSADARLMAEQMAMYDAIAMDVPNACNRMVARIGAGPPAVIDASW
jgi:hypothetical protein